MAKRQSIETPKKELFLAYAGLVKLLVLRKDVIEDMLRSNPNMGEPEDRMPFLKDPMSSGRDLKDSKAFLDIGIERARGKISRIEEALSDPPYIQRLASRFELSKEETDLLLCLFFVSIGFMESFGGHFREEGRELLTSVLEGPEEFFFSLPLLSKEGALLKNDLIKIEDEEKSLLETRYTLNDAIAVALALDFGLGGSPAGTFHTDKLDLGEDPLLTPIEPGRQGIEALGLSPSTEAPLRAFAQAFLFNGPGRTPGIELVSKDRESGLEVIKALSWEIKAKVALARLPLLPNCPGVMEERLKDLLEGEKRPLLLALEAYGLSKQSLRRTLSFLPGVPVALLTDRPLGVFKASVNLIKEKELNHDE
jgi:hypothetical protein